MLVFHHDIRRHDEGPFGCRDLRAVIANADEGAPACGERCAEMRDQLGLGQVT